MDKEITFKAETCSECKGVGKTEQTEYTPPFERFMGDCKSCRGTGVTFDSSKPISIKDS